jgi:hypothetical protein
MIGEPRAAMGITCACHTHRELVPQEVHHIWPKGMGGPDTAANKVRICSNAHGAIHDFLDKLIKGNGRVPWTVARHYGRAVRRYAQQGYAESRAK